MALTDSYASNMEHPLAPALTAFDKGQVRLHYGSGSNGWTQCNWNLQIFAKDITVVCAPIKFQGLCLKFPHAQQWGLITWLQVAC